MRSKSRKKGITERQGDSPVQVVHVRGKRASGARMYARYTHHEHAKTCECLRCMDVRGALAQLDFKNYLE